jgi:hypothetical protein
MDDQGFQVWPERKRMLIPYPIPLSAFRQRSPLMQAQRRYVGPKAVAVTDIGAHLKGMAICLPEDVAAWRAELGLPPLTTPKETS